VNQEWHNYKQNEISRNTYPSVLCKGFIPILLNSFINSKHQESWKSKHVAE